MEHNDWYVDEYQPNRWWIRRDAGDGGIETLAQDVETKELADECVLAINSHDQLLAACNDAVKILSHLPEMSPELETEAAKVMTNCILAISATKQPKQPNSPKNHQ